MVHKRKQLIKPLLNNKGTTMVSVIVAFTILLMCAAMFNSSFDLGVKMINLSSDKQKELDKAVENYYLAPKSTTDEVMTFTGQGENININVKKGLYTDSASGIKFYYYSN